jgi:hypothetical protein
MSSFTFQNLSATAKSVGVPLAGVPMTSAESRTYHDALNLLGAALAGARRQATIPVGTDERAQFELVFGYSMLAIGEARAYWSLVSCGLETPALVHLRTLVEHAARASRIILDAPEARRVYESLGASERDLAKDLTLEADVRETLEKQFAPVIEEKPDRRIFPSMADMLKSGTLGGVDNGEYRTMSQVLHGSILALRQVAKITNNVDEDFIAAATLDGASRLNLVRR